jgi:hypothetical protein
VGLHILLDIVSVQTRAELRLARALRFKVGRGNLHRFLGRADKHNSVLLQAMKEDPPPDAKCRDKFLVQSVQIPADKEISNITAIVRMTSPHAQISLILQFLHKC